MLPRQQTNRFDYFRPPGTGKTSLVSALAAHYGLSIYTANLTEFTDRSLMSAVNQVPANSVLLFEDIDCMKSSQARADATSTADAKQNTSQNGVTLSGLLNVLDGFYAPTGVLFVMTTNHVEKLDALCSAQDASIIGCIWERRAIGRRVNCTAASFRAPPRPRQKHFSKSRDPRKLWRSFKACCWVWWKEKRELI